MINFSRLKNKDRIVPIVLIVLIVVALFFSLYRDLKLSESNKNSTATTTVERVRTFPKVTVEAKAAIVYDINEKKIIFEKNINAQLPLASVTKLVTALTASDYLKPEDPVTITREALLVDGDSGLKEGEIWKFKDLLDFMLVSSSNDGAKAIALQTSIVTGEDFISLMNKKIKSIGLNQTYFVNETGLDLNNFSSGSYGSASDLAKLLSFIWENKISILNATTKDNLLLDSYQFKHTANNTNDIVNEIPGLVGSKTGFTDLALGNLAIIFDRGIGQPVAVIVLSSSHDGRFKDTLALVNASLSYFESDEF